MKKLAAVCALVLAVPAMGDIVMNGGFELGTGDDADNWNQLEIFGGNKGAYANANRIGPGFGGPSAYEGSSDGRWPTTGPGEGAPRRLPPVRRKQVWWSTGSSRACSS